MTDPEFWRRRKVFVTGATGFLGSHLTQRLLDYKADILMLVSDAYEPLMESWRGKPIHMVYGELENALRVEDCINKFEIDTVIHLGAQALVGPANRSPRSTFSPNIMGTINVLEAMRTTKTIRQAVVASSDKAYGSHEKLPYKEDAALIGKHPYDCSKACTDLIAQCYASTYGLPILITRCGNFYGPGDLNFNRIIPETIRHLLHGRAPVIRSDGTPIRDYLHIEDGVDAYLTLAENASREELRGQAFNFGTGTPTRVLDLVQILQQICGTQFLPKILDCARNEIAEQHLDSAKARKLLGWSHKWSLEEGLRNTVDWYKKFFEEGKWQTY